MGGGDRDCWGGTGLQYQGGMEIEGPGVLTFSCLGVSCRVKKPRAVAQGLRGARQAANPVGGGMNA